MHSLDCSVNCLVAATYPTGFLKGSNTIDIWRRRSLLYLYFFTMLRTNANLVRQRLNQLSDSRDRGKVWWLYWSLYFHQDPPFKSKPFNYDITSIHILRTIPHIS